MSDGVQANGAPKTLVTGGELLSAAFPAKRSKLKRMLNDSPDLPTLLLPFPSLPDLPQLHGYSTLMLKEPPKLPLLPKPALRRLSSSKLVPFPEVHVIARLARLSRLARFATSTKFEGIIVVFLLYVEESRDIFNIHRRSITHRESITGRLEKPAPCEPGMGYGNCRGKKRYCIDQSRCAHFVGDRSEDFLHSIRIETCRFLLGKAKLLIQFSF